MTTSVPRAKNRKDWETDEIILSFRCAASAVLATVGARRTPSIRQTLLKRNLPNPGDPVFAGNHVIVVNRILDEEGLKFEHEGLRRTVYNLGHTYTYAQLDGRRGTQQSSENFQTGVKMIEKYYSSHIATIIARLP